jgi:hypothetical protein
MHGANTPAYYNTATITAVKMAIVHRPLGLYSQHFISALALKGSKKYGVLHYTGMERLVGDKHSNLLGHFSSYEENEVS